MVIPPATLSKNFATLPDAAATTGVPPGAGISIASCERPLARAAEKVSVSLSLPTPRTGTISPCAGDGELDGSGAGTVVASVCGVMGNSVGKIAGVGPSTSIGATYGVVEYWFLIHACAR